MQKQKLINYLNEYLKISDFKDSSKNGLQVDNSKTEIKKIGYSVDASTYIFDKANEEGVDMLLCHHGMFWGYENVLVGVPYLRAKKLIQSDIALYACHLPLDAHSEVGNNIGLLKGFINVFGLNEDEYSIENFGFYNGQSIGYVLRFNRKIHISSLQTIYSDTFGLQKKLYNFGKKETIQSIGFISGGGGGHMLEAFNANCDVYLTGEAAHHEIMGAKELGQSIMLAGHRETEKIGPKLLAYHLKDKFGIEIAFLDEKY
nr:Nif3-like dinuclear metal center hexameric protein [Candidatus Gracilibacteria bacterium]